MDARKSYGSGRRDPVVGNELGNITFSSYTMDDLLEVPSADVSKLQERGQTEETDDSNTSENEEDGGLDWSKLPSVFH